LKSLLAPNQAFRGIVCFQGFISDFVSPLSQHVRPDLADAESVLIDFNLYGAYASRSLPLTPKAGSHIVIEKYEPATRNFWKTISGPCQPGKKLSRGWSNGSPTLRAMVTRRHSIGD
jgi:hypothetical protein